MFRVSTPSQLHGCHGRVTQATKQQPFPHRLPSQGLMRRDAGTLVLNIDLGIGSSNQQSRSRTPSFRISNGGPRQSTLRQDISAMGSHIPLLCPLSDQASALRVQWDSYVTARPKSGHSQEEQSCIIFGEEVLSQPMHFPGSFGGARGCISLREIQQAI